MATITERLSRGKTVHCVQVRVVGHPPESRTFPTRKLALKWGEDRESELRYGLANLSSVYVKSPTLKELWNRYRVLVGESKWVGVVLRGCIHLPICNKPINTIGDTDLEEFRRYYLEEKRIKPFTLRRYVRILRRPLPLAKKKWGFRHLEDPFEDFLVRGKANVRERVLLDNEYELIVSYIKGSRIGVSPQTGMGKQDFIDIIDIALETAMRRGEIVRIEKGHISEDFTELFIPITKTDKPRKCPLSHKAEQILRRRMQETDGAKLFPYPANRVTRKFISVCHRLGLHNLHFHDLRHTALSRLDRKGFSKGMLKQVSGHQTDKMLFRYLHADMRQTVQRMRELCSE